MSNPDAVSTANNISATVGQILPVLTTIASVLLPGSGPAITLAAKIADGVNREIPEAVALFEQFKSGKTPSQAELDAYADEENGAYAKAMAALKAVE